MTGPTVPDGVTSRTDGAAVPEIGVTQDLRLDRRAGGPWNWVRRPQRLGCGVPRHGADSILNNVSSQYLVLGINMGLGVELTEKLSAGAA